MLNGSYIPGAEYKIGISSKKEKIGERDKTDSRLSQP
jgi:hypothetical protein